MRSLLHDPHGIAVFDCCADRKRLKLGIFIRKDVVENFELLSAVFFLQTVYKIVETRNTYVEHVLNFYTNYQRMMYHVCYNFNTIMYEYS